MKPRIELTALLRATKRERAVSSVAELGRVLFTDYMFAFEVTSILIIVSMVGAVILAKKREE